MPAKRSSVKTPSPPPSAASPIDRAVACIDRLVALLPASPLRSFFEVDVVNFIRTGARIPLPIEPALMMLRARGWMVAVHNDYRQHGRLMTFWLFTRNGVAVKGEGYTDEEALAQVLTQTREGQ